MTKKNIRSRLICISLAGILFFASHSVVFAQESKYKHQKTINLVNLVNDAADLIAQRGESAFKSFMTDGSRWRTGETYIFICGIKGDIFVHEDTSLIGKNEYGLRDINGKPIIQWFIRKALGIGQCGWTHYEWVKPGDREPSWKSTFVKLSRAPSGSIYVVGSGLYDMKMEKEFAIDAVNDALNLIRIMGKDAFRTLRDSTSELVYKDTYVFVLDTLCNMLVNAGAPSLEGTNQKDLMDPSGKYFIREMIHVANEKGQGWVDYQWPKPGKSIPGHKTSFVKKIVIRGEALIVGTGIYPE
ncbi:MAG: cache domain-containing protein [Bacteroidales bacterium]|nr:cache domain-containing protein [Bacteroidales bacterium]